MNPNRKEGRWVLVPTAIERQVIAEKSPPAANWDFAVCGFGPIASAARAMEIVWRHQPAELILVGIAGSFDVEKYPIGSARVFTQLHLDGVGIGAGADFLSCRDVGFAQWHKESGEDVYDRISLSDNANTNDTALLTVCAASANAAQADMRRQRFPEVVGEDMEAFGVAIACRMASIPLRVIRGCSNLVGDRDKSHWRIDEALEAVARELARIE